MQTDEYIRNSVLLNPDILYTTINWLSLGDRISFFNTLKGMPEFRSLSDHEQSEFIDKIVKSLLPGYKSIVLTDKFGLVPNDERDEETPDCRYIFSVMYKESDGIPTANIKNIAKMAGNMENGMIKFKKKDIQSLVSNGIIWNLDGKAGEIVYRNRKVDIYRNDTETGMLRYFINDNPRSEVWYKGSKLFRPGTAPALIKIINFNDDDIDNGDEISNFKDIRNKWVSGTNINIVMIEQWYREDGTMWKCTETMVS